jgi:type IV secretion system protein TrbL
VKMSLRLQLLGIWIALTFVLVACPCALAVPPVAGTQAGHPQQAAKHEAHKSARPCNVEVPVIGGLLSEATNGICEAAGEAVGAAGGLVGEAASAAGNGIMNSLASWMIEAATQITVFVSREMQQTTTPQLESAWYLTQFRPMADLGAALSLLVAMIGLASAAIRRSPEALAATLVGMVRAGLGTALVIPLTVIGVGIADQISSAVLTASPHTFWATIAHAWGTKGFGGFGSSALAMLIALIEVFAGIFVWLELIVRDAAIYVIPLFFAATLAAAIWPVLSAWPGRLARLLLLFVILKPVALIVLSLAGGAAAAGLSFSGGVSGSVGTILAAIVIFALAGFAPWALMYLLAADAESAYMAAGLRAATGGAVTDKEGRSVRSGGGLRNLGSQNGGAIGGQASGDGGSSGSGGNGGGGGAPSGGGGPASGGDMAGTAGDAGSSDGALAVSGETIGAGAVGAAAAASFQGTPSSSQESETQSPAEAQPHSSQGSPAFASAHEDGTRSANGERQSSQGSVARKDARSSASTPQQDGGGTGGQERPGGSNSDTQTPLSSPRSVPRQSAETETRSSSPRRSPVLAGVGSPRSSSPQPHDDQEE